MIADRVAAVRERIARAAARAGRRVEDVTLVAVSKTVRADRVRACFEAGLRDFGENKVQEADGKILALGDLREQGARFHLVGHLQDNKAKRAVALFDCIHSVDGEDRGRRLARLAAETGRILPILIQVDLAGEATKHGIPAEKVRACALALRSLTALRVEGLMVLPPFSEDPEESRPYFRRLKALGDELFREGLLEASHLSMGMSHDFEQAVEEGATLLRIGTAIFGERPTPPPG